MYSNALCGQALWSWSGFVEDFLTCPVGLETERATGAKETEDSEVILLSEPDNLLLILLILLILLLILCR